MDGIRTAPHRGAWNKGKLVKDRNFNRTKRQRIRLARVDATGLGDRSRAALRAAIPREAAGRRSCDEWNHDAKEAGIRCVTWAIGIECRADFTRRIRGLSNRGAASGIKQAANDGAPQAGHGAAVTGSR